MIRAIPLWEVSSNETRQGMKAVGIMNVWGWDREVRRTRRGIGMRRLGLVLLVSAWIGQGGCAPPPTARTVPLSGADGAGETEKSPPTTGMPKRIATH